VFRSRQWLERGGTATAEAAVVLALSASFAWVQAGNAPSADIPIGSESMRDRTSVGECTGCHGPGDVAATGSWNDLPPFDPSDTSTFPIRWSGASFATIGFVPMAEPPVGGSTRTSADGENSVSGVSSAGDRSGHRESMNNQAVTVTRDGLQVCDSALAPSGTACSIDAAILSMNAGSGVTVRQPMPDPGVSIAHELAFSEDERLVYLRGAVPVVLDPRAPQGSIDAYGGIESQTVSALTAVAESLYPLGMTMGDIVEITVYLVAPRGRDPMDLTGFNRGYSHFFGTAGQPNVPARSLVVVGNLAVPGWLVEMELTASVPGGAADSVARAHGNRVGQN